MKEELIGMPPSCSYAFFLRQCAFHGDGDRYATGGCNTTVAIPRPAVGNSMARVGWGVWWLDAIGALSISMAVVALAMHFQVGSF